MLESKVSDVIKFIDECSEVKLKSFDLHEQRMFKEITEVYLKLEGLKKFISTSSIYQNLPPDEKVDQVSQMTYMDGYVKVLARRIQRFVNKKS